MKEFSTLDPISLRAFRYAAHFGHFTEAAKKAGLTQSGISQHVSRLEADLGVKLFFRNGKSVAITPEGKRLVRFIEAYADQVDQLRDEFDQRLSQPKGQVSYAMPSSCLKTPHFEMLLEKRRVFPLIDIQVTIAHSEDVLELLIDGRVDFGFVTRQRKHPALNFAEFAQEEYVLAGRELGARATRLAKDLESMAFVRYPGMDVLFESWKSVYVPKNNLTADELHYTGRINDLTGAITMVKHGVGSGVFPKHCVQRELDAGELESFPPNGETCAKAFPIWLVRRADASESARVRTVIDAFWSMMK